jgi:hypothetical protein
MHKQGNIKIILTEICSEEVSWTDMAKDKIQL